MSSKAFGLGVVRFLVLVLVLAGCGHEASAPANGTGSPQEPDQTSAGARSEAGTGGTTAPGQPNGQTPLRLEIKMTAVLASAEDHVCMIVPLPNDKRVWIKSIHATLTRGSHHLIVDRRPEATQPMDKPASCAPTMGTDSSRLIIAQQPDTLLDLPEHTGLRVEPHQPIFLQLHYINATSKSADIAGAVEFTLVDEAAGAPIEVQSLFAGATNISLPRHQSGMAQFFYLPPATSSRKLQAFAVTSHTHSLGVNATIERVSSVDAPAVKPIHESMDWAEPPLTRFDPPLVFDGNDGLRLRCRYQNDTDRDVSFGTRFQDEMCFMWLYFYVEQP
jgi:hypothetical protein